jgi:alkylation response protein AidB-like acyl-CoA dehydrogenase
MSLPLSPEDLAFQAEVRQFVEANLPADIAARVQEHKGDYKGDYTRWMKILAQKGWSAPHWPTQYGGAGLTPWQRHLFEEVVQSYPVPFAAPFGTTMVGPVIYTFGTAAQKAKFLPGTANFDIWWCQGYSEPGSGSDLAKLSTKAVRDGDDYIVSGTKIWTSYAQHADWIFCLVRTAFDDRKPQQGISFLLFDMKTPGIEIQPIISIDGQHHLNMVHFTDVRVPVENRIGEENMGWTYAKFLLQYERFGIAEVAESQARITKLRRMAREQDLEGDTSYMQALAQTEIELKALAGTNLRRRAGQTGWCRGFGTENPGFRNSPTAHRACHCRRRLVSRTPGWLWPRCGFELGRGPARPPARRRRRLLLQPCGHDLRRHQRNPTQCDRQGDTGPVNDQRYYRPDRGCHRSARSRTFHSSRAGTGA